MTYTEAIKAMINDVIQDNPALKSIITIKDTRLTTKTIGQYLIVHFAESKDYYIFNIYHYKFATNATSLAAAYRYAKNHNACLR